ncbi:UbiD family decarboxylase domain-containing protein, partial [Thermodesulfobacteriota bacterium]
NICNLPACMMMAATGGVHSIVPLGADEMAIAGALQGSPVELVKAKTVDAYAVEKAESLKATGPPRPSGRQKRRKRTAGRMWLSFNK